MNATTKIYLDTRRIYSDGSAPVKLVIRQGRKAAMLDIKMRIRPEHWDESSGQAITRADRNTVNQYLNWVRAQADTLIMKLTVAGELGEYDAIGLRDAVAHEILGTEKPARRDKSKLFLPRYLRFTEMKSKGTQRVYVNTLNKMREFDDDLERRTFEDISLDWLKDFEVWLRDSVPSPNARSIHLRNIRAVFNDAIDAEITTAYPFRRLKIKTAPTRKRSLSVEALRKYWFFEPEEVAVKYHDIFKIMFLLIGINLKDLHSLREIRNGRIEFNRAKTHRPYSIKVEPEAEALIGKYRGKEHLLIWGDTYKDTYDLLAKINNSLKRIGPVEVGKQNRKTYHPLQPEISTYWARHTWATIAAELEIPKETIAAALGHGGNTVTDIYIDFDRKKVDEANRRVIDWVLYGKK